MFWTFQEITEEYQPHRNLAAPPFSNDGSIVVIHGYKGDTPDLPQRTTCHSDKVLDMLGLRKSYSDIKSGEYKNFTDNFCMKHARLHYFVNIRQNVVYNHNNFYLFLFTDIR